MKGHCRNNWKNIIVEYGELDLLFKMILQFASMTFCPSGFLECLIHFLLSTSAEVLSLDFFVPYSRTQCLIDAVNGQNEIKNISGKF